MLPALHLWHLGSRMGKYINDCVPFEFYTVQVLMNTMPRHNISNKAGRGIVPERYKLQMEHADYVFFFSCIDPIVARRQISKNLYVTLKCDCLLVEQVHQKVRIVNEL